MPYVDVFVDSAEVLNDLTDDELRKELDKRMKRQNELAVGTGALTDSQLLEQVWRDFRGMAAPTALREYIWRVLGKVL